MKSLLLAFAVILPLAAQQDSRLAWAPVPATPATWVAPNRPLWKLSELLAQHKGQQNWTQTVASDSLLHADYISMAPGAKTPLTCWQICLRPWTLCREFDTLQGSFALRTRP